MQNAIYTKCLKVSYYHARLSVGTHLLYRAFEILHNCFWIKIGSDLYNMTIEENKFINLNKFILNMK